MRRAVVLWCALALILVVSTGAQSVITPNSYANTNTGLVLNSLTRQMTRTFQMGIAASELSSIPKGALITGLSLRAGTTTSNPATWPATNAVWKNYDITLAEAANSFSNWSTTFAANMKNPIQVRSGPFTIPAKTWANLGTPGPNAFDTFYFDFQKPYPYMGGDLVVYITHDGNNASSALYMARANNAPTSYGVGHYASTYNATTWTSTTGPQITRFHYGYGPTGCAVKQPLLITTGDLKTPGTVNFAVTNAKPNSVGGMVVGLLKTTVPLPGGCKGRCGAGSAGPRVYRRRGRPRMREASRPQLPRESPRRWERPAPRRRSRSRARPLAVWSFLAGSACRHPPGHRWALRWL